MSISTVAKQMKSTDRKIAEMEALGKADQSVGQALVTLNSAYAKALTDAKTAREQMRLAKAKCKELKVIRKKSNPLQDLNPLNEENNAKRTYRRLQRNYSKKIVELKKAQKPLRAFKANLRQQYSTVLKFSELAKKVDDITKGGNQDLISQQCCEAYKAAVKKFKEQSFHVDLNNPNNTTNIDIPSSELSNNINSAYSEHIASITQQKLKQIEEIARQTTQQIGGIASKTAGRVSKGVEFAKRHLTKNNSNGLENEENNGEIVGNNTKSNRNDDEIEI